MRRWRRHCCFGCRSFFWWGRGGRRLWSRQKTPGRVLARDFGIYIIVGWLPFLALTAALVRLLGGIHFWFLVGLHFAGGTFILYLGVKTIGVKIGRGRRLNFDWRAMTLLVWSNPKAWLTIPAGSLAATFANSAAINIAAFAAISLRCMSPPQFFGAPWRCKGKKSPAIKLVMSPPRCCFPIPPICCGKVLSWQRREMCRRPASLSEGTS